MKINSKKYDLSFMKIQNLKITNFRGIRELDLDFSDRDLVVLVGVNGVGKSSILDISRILLSYLAELLGKWRYYVERFKYYEETKESLMRNNFHIANILMLNNQKKLELTSKELPQVRNEDITISAEESSISISVVFIYESQNKNIFWKVKNNKRNEINVPEYLEYIYHDLSKNNLNFSEDNLPVLIYYSVNRAIPNSLLDRPEDSESFLSQAYHQALTGTNVGFKHFFQWFRILEDIENEEIRDNPEHRDKKLEAVRSAIYDLVPEFSNLRVRRSPLRMTVNKNNEELEINQLSDGEKCLIAMVGDIARRLAIANSNLENPLEGTGVVLIDEIELHLHPQWQKDVIPSLRRTFPNCQFIVTTHSPQVVSQVKPENVYILEKQADNIVVSHPELSYGREIGQIVEDVMGGVARPSEVRDELMQLFQLIEEGNLDAARQLHEQISDKIGADDPQLIKASASIRRREILNR
ncbi:ATP binding protein [Geitlerinema sp. FC II]|nr:ATP binding protein [Geitlerinema sp. FC II]